jgi:hypothetical protein
MFHIVGNLLGIGGPTGADARLKLPEGHEHAGMEVDDAGATGRQATGVGWVWRRRRDSRERRRHSEGRAGLG